ncbi:hypothetical protein L596_023458 [Steinernema carpocapsae]|uniref:Decapping nuclease n=1 Tax=Steinernema carpocapsae TaxID=34508 RepID=A0A4U5MDX9_STECR|nr:hypothetical protein L596_023458 [Steinernema carpocapsae]
MNFAMSELKTRIDETSNFNKSSYLGRQFPREITQAAELPVVKWKIYGIPDRGANRVPHFTVMTSGEIDAIDEENQLIEIKCFKGGLNHRFWKERSCKLFLQMFFSGSRRCLHGHHGRDGIVDIREIGLERLAEKGANLPDRLFPWFKDDVIRFIDSFISSVYQELEKSPKVVFNINKDEGHSRFYIERTEESPHNFFPPEFLTHFNIDF